jgi:hypothetical protein
LRRLDVLLVLQDLVEGADASEHSMRVDLGPLVELVRRGVEQVSDVLLLLLS